jgi:large subunit ribosomal protein L31
VLFLHDGRDLVVATKLIKEPTAALAVGRLFVYSAPYMKKDIHPDNYRPVIFADASSGVQFLIPSTVETKEKGTYEGKEYPLFRVEISSASHPVYTGESKSLDTTGRAEKFRNRQAKAKK